MVAIPTFIVVRPFYLEWWQYPLWMTQKLRVTWDLLFKVGVIPTMVVFAYIYSLQGKTR